MHHVRTEVSQGDYRNGVKFPPAPSESPSTMSISPASSAVPLRVGQKSRNYKTRRLIAIVAVIVIVALSVGLSVGLGVGLNVHKHSSSAASSTASPAPSLVGTFPQTNFVLNGLQGQASQTRNYFFSMTEATGSPDGVQKPMLVVNGMHPGPTIEANQGDRVVANVTNHLPNTTQLMITEDTIEVIDLLVNNLDDGDHPFHLHGHRPYIMGVGAGRYIGQALNEVNPLRRDTVLIPAYSWTILRFITDNPGLWAFHCHIAWHMAAGLLTQINSLPSKAAQLDLPQAIIDQCNVQTVG
ncbi:hypothetical protein EUX98_g2246 [Antrodiella citrinella]|uniref:Plastocyanin-like domain-containing protein n=1 Tax=Antrodiella citrinella TaxID=2447956 RepID=A0A4S4N0X6_9APHY|nr:hypothetical protein EUX98_g2246 [Antrodiella citrinella]